MAKLYFRYGAMNCGKSTALIQVDYNYRERGMATLIIKPWTDTKGEDRIVSRLSVSRRVDLFARPEDDLFGIIAAHKEAGPLDCVLVDEAHGLMDAEALDATISADRLRAAEYAEPGAVSITQVSECGSVYPLDALEAIGEVARRHGLPVHMDGARFANAIAALGCTPAEMTWKRGVTALSLGATKNGCLGVEAVVFFDPAPARHFPFVRKRTGHLLSKHRYLAAQMDAWLDGGLWLDLARAANRAAVPSSTSFTIASLLIA